MRFHLKPEILSRSFLIILLSALPVLLFSQVKKPWNDPGYDNKRVHFGFSVGVNTMDLNIKRTLESDTSTHPVLIPDITAIQPGFQVQIVSNLKIADDLDLRFLPGISFGAREITFYAFGGDSIAGSEEIESSYLDFPLSLKYRARRLNNYRPYILAGMNYRYDMAAKKQDNFRFKPGNIFGEAGVGVDWYLPYFKLSTEIKAGYGFFDILARDSKSNQNYLSSIKSINPYVLGFSFHFE